MTGLIIKGTAKDVVRILNNLKERFGNITITELCKKFDKEELVLQ